jgi:hypothetical protein
MSPPVDTSQLTEAYEQYWLLPEEASLDDYRQLSRAIATLEAALPPEIATTILEQTARTFHHSTGRCPFCQQPGPLHLPLAGDLRPEDAQIDSTRSLR